MPYRLHIFSIGMTAIEALTHEPMYIAMKSSSSRYNRRRYLREELLNKFEIKLFSVVQIIKNQSKEFSGSNKESYDFLSPCFIVVNVKREREIKTYELANLFTLVKLPGSYSMNELRISNIDYVTACSKEEKELVSVLKVKNDIVSYTVAASDRVFEASKSILNDK